MDKGVKTCKHGQSCRCQMTYFVKHWKKVNINQSLCLTSWDRFDTLVHHLTLPVRHVALSALLCSCSLSLLHLSCRSFGAFDHFASFCCNRSFTVFVCLLRLFWRLGVKSFLFFSPFCFLAFLNILGFNWTQSSSSRVSRAEVRLMAFVFV